MPKYGFGFYVTMKVQADDEKQAAKIAKELRNIAVNAVKGDGRSTAKSSTVEPLV